jgi:predicted protein tyrosine phosphatase
MRPLPFKISICGKLELDVFRKKGVTHLLSLEDPHFPKETPRWFRGQHLQLLFHDVENHVDAALMEAQLPRAEDVSRVLEFGRECQEAARNRAVHLLVHCYAGISRSTAAAFAVLTQAWGPGSEKEALECVAHIRPEALPNVLIVQHADTFLRRDGAMVKALQPLREAFMRRVREWASKEEDNE